MKYNYVFMVKLLYVFEIFLKKIQNHEFVNQSVVDLLLFYGIGIEDSKHVH